MPGPIKAALDESRLPTTLHSRILATVHGGVLATRHIVGSKHGSSGEGEKRHKAQDTCCNLLHRNLLRSGFGIQTEYAQLWSRAAQGSMHRSSIVYQQLTHCSQKTYGRVSTVAQIDR